jgi:ATP-binding cassette subfamily B protein
MLGMVYRTIRQGLTDMAAMFELIDTPAEITDKPNAPALAVSGGAIVFDDVHFAYDAERQILKGVSFDIKPGHTLAVVGPSGAGKSTIARLLYRFYDVTGGRVTIDDQDLRDVTQSSLRSSIGIVPQEHWLQYRLWPRRRKSG